MSLKLKNFLYKKFTNSCRYSGGRNRMGRITIYHRVLVVLLKRES